MFFEKITNPDDGMKYYKIPKNTKLYRGDTAMYLHHAQNPDIPITNYLMGNPIFFGISIEEVAQYGIVYEFRLNKDINLLAFDDIETLNKLHETVGDAKLQKIIDTNYGRTTGKRNSVAQNDKLLISYICETGKYHGYATPTLETDFGGSFHPEILLCNMENITFVGQITKDKNEITSLIDTHEMQLLGKKQKESRKKKTHRKDEFSPIKMRPLFGSPNKKGSLFDDDDDEVKGGKSRNYRNKSKSKKRSAGTKKNLRK
jgi:hypothetical protein